MVIKFKRLSDKAIAPTKAHSTDAGFDLTCTRITTEINECGQLVLVYHTDLALEIPEGYYGAIVPRSSISKKSLRQCNAPGTVDAGYRGEVTVKMVSTTDVIPSVYKEGERMAQILILPVPDVQFEESETLSETERGEGGYGSTGNETIYSAATGSQSLPETEGEPTNSETATEASGETTDGLEEAQ